MFERFTERASRAVVFSQEEARTLNHSYIGTEHILLGLLREERGLAARALESLDITVERVRSQVVRMVGRGEEASPGQIPFTPRAKRALELAAGEALSLGHNYVGTEHILLGLVRENEGVAMRILFDFDADAARIRNEVIAAVRAAPDGSAVPPSGGTGPPPRRGTGPPPSRGAGPTPSRFADQPLAAPPDLELGWRARPIALAALGAAVLARIAFDRSKTGHLEPLEMQLLAQLVLQPANAAAVGPGELLDSLAVALACDRDDLHDAVCTLADQRLVNCEEEQDGDQRISITTAGAVSVRSWLEHTAPLFGRWPLDHPDVDDAMG